MPKVTGDARPVGLVVYWSTCSLPLRKEESLMWPRSVSPKEQHQLAAPAASSAWRLLLLPLIVVLVLLAAGTTLWHTIRPAGSEVAAGKGPLAPAIVASTIDGVPFTLAAQRNKVVVLYSMAAWCTACVPEATALGQLGPAVGAKRVVTLLVDESPQSDSPRAVHGFRARSQGPNQSWVIDRGGSIARAFGIAALDSTVVIDRGGHVAARYQASVDRATLEAAVRGLL